MRRIDLQKLSPMVQVFLARPEMEGVRRFVEDYCLDAAFDGELDPERPIIDIVERPLGRPPFV